MSFPGVKQPRLDTDRPPLLVPRLKKKKAELYLYSLSGPSRPVTVWTLLFTDTNIILLWKHKGYLDHIRSCNEQVRGILYHECEVRHSRRIHCTRGELSYLAPLGSENISAPYFKQCFFQREGLLPPRQSNTTPPSPKTEITNILFYILNFASIIKFKM